MERLCWRPLPAEAIIMDVKEVQHSCFSFVHLKEVLPTKSSVLSQQELCLLVGTKRAQLLARADYSIKLSSFKMKTIPPAGNIIILNVKAEQSKDSR